MKELMIDMMVAMMPFMKPLMWLGIVAALIGVLLLITNIAFKIKFQKSIMWSFRIALATAIFFLAAQIAGYFLNMPPAVNFGDSSKFEFILISFWQIGLALLITSLIIKFLTTTKIIQQSAI